MHWVVNLNSVQQSVGLVAVTCAHSDAHTCLGKGIAVHYLLHAVWS